MGNETSFVPSLSTVNIVLLILLGISLFAKYILKFLSWAITQRLSKDKNYELKCLYLKQSHNHQQCQLHYGDKYLERNLCSKKKCPAYKTSFYTFEDWKNAKLWRFLLFSFIENCSELVSIILIIYNLLK